MTKLELTTLLSDEIVLAGEDSPPLQASLSELIVLLYLNQVILFLLRLRCFSQAGQLICLSILLVFDQAVIQNDALQL